MERYECLQSIAPLLSDALVISCIGGTRTEWNALKTHPDFTAHAMGLSSSVGLGLALSRGLTEAMGGTLTAEDTPGGGLTMTVSLPAAPGD